MKRFDQINVIPFIDIMLVLLAIVLTTASFIVQGPLDIELPPAASREPPPAGEALEIAIDRGETVYVDARPVDLETLRRRLGETAQETPINLRVDSEVRFARFVQVIDLLKAQRLQHVAILTRAE
ncbi:MAG TPA: biopolymer transporter ExbD [Burkholderiales bacterium]